MVTTFLPLMSSIAVMHERTACPPTCTVQEPQSAWPQPYLVPRRPDSSRRYQSSGSEGSPSQLCASPLTVSLIIVALLGLEQRSRLSDRKQSRALSKQRC